MTNVTAVRRAAVIPRSGVERVRLAAQQDRLYFAQVREDAQLEIAALEPTADKTLVVVGSGGCTALSLIAAGAGRVIAVDVNETQNHLIELKALSAASLTMKGAVRFLGGWRAPERWRETVYEFLRRRLSLEARHYWDAHPESIRRGVLTVGVSERFIALVVTALILFVHSPARVRQLLASSTLAEQADYYARVWNSRRWRALFAVLMNRAAFNRAYDPAFFEHVDNPSFARHFHRLAEHALTRIPVRDNYFLHQMLTGEYPNFAEGLPLYLRAAGNNALRDQLTLVDATYTDYLRSCASSSIHGFALSNICEWLNADQIDELFQEIVRTAAPGARVCFRNFVGWTEVPERWRNVVVEDKAAGELLMRSDRSVVQRRFALCRIERSL